MNTHEKTTAVSLALISFYFFKFYARLDAASSWRVVSLIVIVLIWLSFGGWVLVRRLKGEGQDSEEAELAKEITMGILKSRAKKVQEEFPEKLAARKQAVFEKYGDVTYAGRNLIEKLDSFSAEHAEAINYRHENHAEILAETFEEFEDLLTDYLGSDAARREMLREFVYAHAAYNFIFTYWDHKPEQIKSKTDGEHVRFALAAISLANLAPDFRDAHMGLDETKEAAIQAGIDWVPLFEEAAEKASAAPNSPGSPISARKLIRERLE